MDPRCISGPRLGLGYFANGTVSPSADTIATTSVLFGPNSSFLMLSNIFSRCGWMAIGFLICDAPRRRRIASPVVM